MLVRLQEPLLDLSASRPVSSLSWGVPLPKDPTHVMCVADAGADGASAVCAVLLMLLVSPVLVLVQVLDVPALVVP